MLKKRLNDKTMAGAQYTENGIALRVTTDEDRHLNSVALVETVDGKIRLTLFDDAIQRYGIEIYHENIDPVDW